MENITAYGVRRIMEEIPKFILKQVFEKPDYNMGMFFQSQTVNLNSAIASAVITSAILPDLKLISGEKKSIDLEGLEYLQNSDGTMVIHIPPSRTGGREIVGCYRIDFLPCSDGAYTYYANTSRSEVDKKVDAIYDAATSIPVTSTSDCVIIAPNTILVDLSGVFPPVMSAEVELGISDSLQHIPPKAYELFGEMCVLRCQQYIYNESIIEMNRGFVDRGKELGIYGDMIREYRDSAKSYRDLLKKWRKYDFLMDKQKVSDYLKWITPSII